MLEPRTHAEWNLFVLKVLFWLSVVYAVSAALVELKAAGVF